MSLTETYQTFKELRNKAADDFKIRKPAAALVYHGGREEDFVGIRIECPQARKEFVSYVTFGRDSEGDLYYNNIKDLTEIGDYVISFRVGEVLHIEIRNPNRDIVATFVGADPASAISWSQFDTPHPLYGRDLRGSWNDYNGLNVPSTIQCTKGSTDVTISLPSLAKKVTFNLPKPSVNCMNHDGTMTVTSITDIPNGTYNMVDFDADRVLFYPKAGTRTMTAYFIPSDQEKADLIALGLQAFTSSSANAVWGSYP